MKIAFLTIFLLPLVVVAQIGAKVQQNKIHGLWQNSQFGYEMRLMLKADGTGSFDGEMISFTTMGTKLSIFQIGEPTVYIYGVQGNTLTLSGGDLDGVTITFKRSTGLEKVSVEASAPDIRSRDNMTDNSGLVGLWKGKDKTIEFKPDGKCVYQGQTFSYKISQGHIDLTAAQVKITLAYSIKGNQLITDNHQETSNLYAWRRDN